MTPNPVTLSEDVRADLVGAAATAERRNRPSMLVVGGVLAVGVALVYLIWSVGAAAAADEEFEHARGDAERVEREVGALLDMDAQKKAFDQRLRPDTGILSRLEEMAATAGMIKPPITNSPETPGPNGVYRNKFSAQINDQTAESIFAWIAAAATIDGLTVTVLEISPDLQLLPTTEEGTARWQGRIEFARYEKK